MKLAMNGALTIGTLDGASIEMLAELGADNIFIFGLTREAVQRLGAGGRYRPRDIYMQFPHIRRIFDAFDSDLLCPDEPGLLRWIGTSILDYGDYYYHMADLPAYIDMQQNVSDAFGRPSEWATKAILNVARVGRFSSDRTEAEYARDIWGTGRFVD